MRHYKKAYKWGGVTPTEGLTNNTAIASAVANPLVDMFDKGNKYGRQTGLASGLKKGASLAAAGSALGPAGAIAGGVIGLGAGLIGSIGEKRKEKALEQSMSYQDELGSLERGRSALASNPSLLYGDKDAGYFKNGGPIKGDGTIVGDFGARLLNYLQSPAVEKSLKGFKRKGKAITTGIVKIADPTGITNYPDVKSAWSDGKFDYNDITQPLGALPAFGMFGKSIKGMKYGTDIFKESTLSKTLGVIDKLGKADNTKDLVNEMELGGSLTKDYFNNTQLKPLNRQAVEVDGPSHEQGGVQIPGAEVEGGETISKGFVFSDALGFSKLHKPIAKAMGELEKKPSSPIRSRTMKVLKARENNLALQQETFKQQLGIV